MVKSDELRLLSDETVLGSPNSLHDETYSDPQHSQGILTRVQVR